MAAHAQRARRAVQARKARPDRWQSDLYDHHGLGAVSDGGLGCFYGFSPFQSVSKRAANLVDSKLDP